MSHQTESEEEYFLRQEIEKKREAVKKRQAELAEEERERLKKLHWMRCAKCGAELHEVVFNGVKVDKCFSCGGVYLDDGELEQLVGKPGWFESMSRLFR